MSEPMISLSVNGAVLDCDVCRAGETLHFTARVPKSLGALHGTLRVYCDDTNETLRYAMQPDGDTGFYADIKASEFCRRDKYSALCYYCVELDCPCEGAKSEGMTPPTQRVFLCKTPDGFTPILRYEDYDIHSFQLLVIPDDADTPHGVRGGLMYQVFVDRFYSGDETSPKPALREHAVKNDDWYEGIPEHASVQGGHIENNEFFGGTLWGVRDKLDYFVSLGVTVLYLSPVFRAYSNHKYDTGDYETVDEMFGGSEAFKALLDAARVRGIRVICDGVFNHTGDDSRYFNKKGRYDSLGAYQSKASPYYPWYKFTDYPEDYKSWWGIKILPALDSSNREYIDYICGDGGILAKWMRFGVGGWRLDVADELDDAFLCALRTRVKKEDADAPIWGEVWEDATTKFAYGNRRRYFRGAQLDSVMNYPFRTAILNFVKYGASEAFGAAVESIVRHYPKHATAMLMNHIGTHDTQRAITVLAGKEPHGYDNDTLATMRLTEEEYARGVGYLSLAVLLQFSLPGIPCIYYGDEAGMQGYHDPFNRRPYPWGREDQNLLSFYRILGLARARYRTLFADGRFVPITMQNGVVAYRRETEEEVLYVAVNRGNVPYTLCVDGKWSNILTNKSGKGDVTLAPNDGVWLYVDRR